MQSKNFMRIFLDNVALLAFDKKIITFIIKFSTDKNFGSNACKTFLKLPSDQFQISQLSKFEYEFIVFQNGVSIFGTY